ncbi:MAG: hypothetical protein Q4G27_11075 [Flavobacteriaceae bacterium]|nr:hypothetical protein [Flavobacteriaceae bacterium]
MREISQNFGKHLQYNKQHLTNSHKNVGFAKGKNPCKIIETIQNPSNMINLNKLKAGIYYITFIFYRTQQTHKIIKKRKNPEKNWLVFKSLIKMIYSNPMVIKKRHNPSMGLILLFSFFLMGCPENEYSDSCRNQWKFMPVSDLVTISPLQEVYHLGDSMTIEISIDSQSDFFDEPVDIDEYTLAEKVLVGGLNLQVENEIYDNNLMYWKVIYDGMMVHKSRIYYMIQMMININSRLFLNLQK